MSTPSKSLPMMFRHTLKDWIRKIKRSKTNKSKSSNLKFKSMSLLCKRILKPSKSILHIITLNADCKKSEIPSETKTKKPPWSRKNPFSPSSLATLFFKAPSKKKLMLLKNFSLRSSPTSISPSFNLQSKPYSPVSSKCSKTTTLKSWESPLRSFKLSLNTSTPMIRISYLWYRWSFKNLATLKFPFVNLSVKWLRNWLERQKKGCGFKN